MRKNLREWEEEKDVYQENKKNINKRKREQEENEITKKYIMENRFLEIVRGSFLQPFRTENEEE